MDDYSNLDLCQVEMNGDRFLLSIPSITIWDEFLLYCTYRKDISKKCDVLHHSCVYERRGDQVNILDSMYYEDSLDDPKRILAHINNDLLCGKDLDTPSFFFRPMLIPLNHNGDIDDSMEQCDGELVDGGLFLIEKRNDKLALPVYIGQADRPNQELYEVNLTDFTMSLIDVGDSDSLREVCNMEPIKWLVCKGCLVATQAIISMSIADMMKLKVFPNPRY